MKVIFLLLEKVLNANVDSIINFVLIAKSLIGTIFQEQKRISQIAKPSQMSRIVKPFILPEMKIGRLALKE